MIGPITIGLLCSCAYWPDVRLTIASIGTNPDARRLVYGCANGRSLSQVFRDGDLADVLSEAVEAALELSL